MPEKLIHFRGQTYLINPQTGAAARWVGAGPSGLGELGFWEAIVGGITSIFGGGSQAKVQTEQIRAQRDIEIEQQKTQQETVKRAFKAVTKQSKFQSNILMIAVVGFVAIILIGPGSKRK